MWSILATPWKSLEILGNPERGEGPETGGPGNLKSSPKSCFLIIHSINQGNFFKDPDEQYTGGVSLPVHHTPPNKSGSFSTKIKLGEEPWRCGP